MVSLQHILQSSIRTVGPKTARVLFALDFPLDLDTHSERLSLSIFFIIFPFSSIFYFIDSIGKSRGGQSLGSSKSFADMAQLLIVSLILAVRGSEIQADHGCWLFPIVYPSSAGGAGCTLQCVGISRISWIHVNLCYTNLLSRCLVWFINLWGTSPNGRYGKYAVQCGAREVITIMVFRFPCTMSQCPLYLGDRHIESSGPFQVLGQWKVCCTSAQIPLSVF